jgi:hypothetical protein
MQSATRLHTRSTALTPDRIGRLFGVLTNPVLQSRRTNSRAIFGNVERIQKLGRYNPVPTKSGSVIFQTTLAQFAAKIELSHTVR